MEDIVDTGYGFAFGEVIYLRGGVYGPLANQYVSLIFVHEGRIRVTCDRETTILVSGQAAFFKNEHLLLFEMDRDVQHRIGWCEGVPGNQWGSDTSPLNGAKPLVAISKRLSTLQQVGVDLGYSSSDGLNEVRNAIGYAVFTAFFHEAQFSERNRLIPRSIQRVKKHIEDNFSKEITLNHLTSISNLSSQHLVSSFRKHIGLTPIRYLWQTRASRGRELLLRSGLTVSEIAYQCGYKTPFHFSRQIKECFDMSPTEVRASKGYRQSSDAIERPRDVSF